ncbi:MAG: hypothetical protein NTZ56_17960 [Acidobacteria bacterium]|nr:hypothetical protein [Acidobacteriota bacterium]
MTFMMMMMLCQAAPATPLRLADLPAAVQKAVEKETQAGAKIEKIKTEKVTLPSGREETGYEVEFELKDQEREIVYAASGEVLQIEEEISWKQVPAAAQRAIQAAAKGGKLRKTDRLQRQGQVLYEAELEIGGKRSSQLFTAAGQPVPKPSGK